MNHRLKMTAFYIFASVLEYLTNNSRKMWSSLNQLRQRCSDAAVSWVRQIGCRVFHRREPAEVQSNEPDHIVKLRKHHDFLATRMEPESGVADHLLSVGVFTYRELEWVRSEESVVQKNMRILHFMLQKDQDGYKKFLESLDSTKQSHIVRYLNGDGWIHPDYPDERPLTLEEISHIRDNIDELIERIEPYSVTDHLYALNCLTRRNVMLIKSKSTQDEVTRQLLSILTRRSKRDLKTFCAVLREHRQNCAAELLKPVLPIVGFIRDDLKDEVNFDEKRSLNEIPRDVLETIFLKVFRVRLSSDYHGHAASPKSTAELLSRVCRIWHSTINSDRFKTRSNLVRR